MEKGLVKRESLTAIGNAIREKNGTSNTYTPDEMPNAIKAIEGGGGGGLPPELYVLSDKQDYFYKSSFGKYFYDKEPEKFSTKDLTSAEQMFYGYEKNNYPVFNFKYLTRMDMMFQMNWGIKTAPEFHFTQLKDDTSRDGPNYSLSNMFQDCSLSEIPDDYFEKWGNWKDKDDRGADAYIRAGRLFGNTDIKKVPRLFCFTDFSDYVGFSGIIDFCHYVRDIDLPIPNKFTRNWGDIYSFREVSRLGHITFDKNRVQYKDQPLDWNNVRIQAYSRIGYTSRFGNQFPPELEITDKVSYDANKNNPMAWTRIEGYSFYNHDSAVETINSLPMTTGKNTITFHAKSGSLTDGGAIDTLTPDEIAVATAKGWTISYN